MRILSLLSASVLLSASGAMAADLGTYRPGAAYSSVAAPGADVCESHCGGDAQCRGWNYVKVNPTSQGVCEFMSSVGAPISSAIAISGTSNAAPMSSRVMQGGSNTVRVGTAPTATNTTRVGQSSPSGRRIVREPVAQRARPQSASTPRQSQDMSLTAQQNRFRQAAPQATPQRPNMQPRPQLRPILDGAGQPQMQQPARAQRPTVRPQATTRPTMNRRRPQGPRNVAPQQSQMGQPYPPQQAMRSNSFQMTAPQMRALPTGQPIPPSAQSMPRRSVAAPEYAAAPQPANPVALSAGQAQTSLFGSLNDDVKVPAPLRAGPVNPSAPIPTQMSRPTAPVSESALGELAGGL